MSIPRPAPSAEPARLLIAACIAATLLFAWGLAAVRHRHPAEAPARIAASPLPGITLDVEAGGALVVTSLRSNARGIRGVQVGDRLAAVNGRPVPSRAVLAHVLAADGSHTVVLTLARRTGTVDVALSRDHR